MNNTLNDKEKLLKYIEENESTLRPFFNEIQKAIIEKIIEKHKKEFKEPGSTEYIYFKTEAEKKQFDKEIMHTLNSHMFKDGLISEQIYYKAKEKIERLK